MLEINLILWLAEHAKKLVKMDAVDVLVRILRKNQELGVQRNLAIVCARLCQVGKFYFVIFVLYSIFFYKTKQKLKPF